MVLPLKGGDAKVAPIRPRRPLWQAIGWNSPYPVFNKKAYRSINSSRGAAATGPKKKEHFRDLPLPSHVEVVVEVRVAVIGFVQQQDGG